MTGQMEALRFDEPRVPPFAGRHVWAVSVMFAVTDEQVVATDHGEQIPVGGEPLRVSHIYCAHCHSFPNGVLSREHCEGSADA